ncbi:HTH domain-containing protein [Anaerovorax sp. IOR16]|uniref:HTH domain-containing protein n=1 Tax=Anaerovorax sp. IOR16 TaxID=2773458 RepID=UPI0019CFB471|nr:HTH domain-containing protein [Anaerovorax sp. IOR16]
MSEKEIIIKMAAEAGAKAALETLEMERNKSIKGRHDRRLRNTKLLLKNYRVFKKHRDNAVYRASQMDESAIDILDLMWDPHNSQEMKVESIKKSAVRTSIIMEHIDEMVGIYKVICSNSGKAEIERKYRVLYAMYIADEPTTAEKIAKSENIDTRTVYKDIDAACDKMAALIFGVDWLTKE